MYGSAQCSGKVGWTPLPGAHESAAHVGCCISEEHAAAHPLQLAEVRQHILDDLAGAPAVQQQRLLGVLHLQKVQWDNISRCRTSRSQHLTKKGAQRGEFAKLGDCFVTNIVSQVDCCIIDGRMHPAAAAALTNLGSRASTMRRARRDLGLGFTAAPPALPASLGLLCRLLKPRPFLAMAPGCGAVRQWPPPHTLLWPNGAATQLNERYQTSELRVCKAVPEAVALGAVLTHATAAAQVTTFTALPDSSPKLMCQLLAVADTVRSAPP
jgi:hypothetical protein